MRATQGFDKATAVHTARLIIRTAHSIGIFSRLDADELASMCQIIGDGWLDPSVTDVLDLSGPEVLVTMCETKRIAAALAGRPCLEGFVHLPGVFPRQTGSNLALVGLAFPTAWDAERALDARIGNLEHALDGGIEAAIYLAAKAILAGSDGNPSGPPTLH